MIDPVVFRRILAAIDRAEINYMLTGSFASAFYGVSRATQDIDLVVDATEAQLKTLVGFLPSEEYYVDLDAALEARRHESMFNVVDMVTGWKIDLIMRKARPFSLSEFERRAGVDIEGTRLFVASLEDVVVSKLEWAKLGSSQRQISDAGALLKMHWKTLDRDYVGQWVAAMELQSQWDDARASAGL
jgi:hypothetical protein